LHSSYKYVWPDVHTALNIKLLSYARKY
jgi:hypothetical protein